MRADLRMGVPGALLPVGLTSTLGGRGDPARSSGLILSLDRRVSFIFDGVDGVAGASSTKLDERRVDRRGAGDDTAASL